MGDGGLPCQSLLCMVLVTSSTDFPPGTAWFRIEAVRGERIGDRVKGDRR